MITSIIENLRAHDELRYTPAFIVYSLFSALIMHVYQMRSSNKMVVAATGQRLQICMEALKEVSKVWLVAKMVHTLFESILGNKHLEERLQRAAGKRHQKNKTSAGPPPPPKPPQEAPKRKFEEMDFPLANGANSLPAPQVSYERSRPQTPAVTPSRDLPQPMPQMSASSPQMTRQNNDAFMGPSRSGTRPTTPFNASYSYPGTPPDLFLVTRNSPNISQELWQNFQPDQLFPADTQINIPQISPVQHHSLVDPALSRPQNMQMHPNNMQQNASQQQMSGQQQMQMQGFDQNDQQAWSQHMDMMAQNQQNSDDAWSNSSNGRNPIVPTTLNVEDWYVFLQSNSNGVNEDLINLYNQQAAFPA
jgi:hypothetical protein